MIYFLISNDGSTILGDRVGDFGVGEYNDYEASRENGKSFLVPVAVTDPSYDPATEVKEGPVDAYDLQTNTATRTFTVRPKTQVELDQDQLEDDLATLREAGKDISLVLVELIEWTLANTSMEAADFSADVRQAFLDIKAIADRLRGI